MNREKYIDKAFGLFQAVLVALMAAIFSTASYLALHFEEISQLRLIIIGSGLGFLGVCFGAVALYLGKLLKELGG